MVRAIALVFAVVGCTPQPVQSLPTTEHEAALRPPGSAAPAPPPSDPDPHPRDAADPQAHAAPHRTCVHRGPRTELAGAAERCRGAAFATERASTAHPQYPAGLGSEPVPAGQLLPPSLRAELAKHCQRLEACVDAAHEAEPELDVEELRCVTWTRRAELWPDAHGALSCVRLDGELPAPLGECVLDVIFGGRGVDHLFREAPDCAPSE